MKRLLALCICLCMVFSTFTFVAYASGGMDVALTSNRYGHIYTDPNQGFRIDVKNNLSGNFSGKVVYNILSDGTSIYSEEKAVEIAVGGTYTDFPVIDFPKYGIFELTASVTDGTNVYGTATIPFSYINGSKNGEGNKKLSVNTHLEVYETRTETINAVRDAGFGGIRNPIYWFEVEEHNKNEYKLPKQAAAIKEAAELGLEPMIVLTSGNGPWGVITPDGESLRMAPSTPEQIQAFANYCAWVAEQYKGYIKYYEIWNEFDQDGSNLGDQSPEAYAKILAAAGEAIKAVDPDIKVVGMCVGVDYKFISKAIGKLNSMGKSNCYDIISAHTYIDGEGYGNDATDVGNLKKIFKKPFWITERGWDTATESTEEFLNGLSDEKQAYYGVWDYLAYIEGDKCDRLFWYDFQDDGTDHSQREENFGLIESVNAEIPGFAKPSYIAFAAMNKLIGQSTYKSTAKSGNAKAYRFTNSKNEDTYVLTGNVGNSITVNMSGKLELLDMYSNVVAIDDNTDGSFKVTLTDEVMYVRKHFEPAGCSVTVSGNELIVKGHAEDDDKQISVMVTSAEGKYVYMGQTTCDSERAYSFTADRKGINELYVKVNYGSLFSSEVQTGFVLKLICNDERIFSLENVTATDNIKLVITVNDAITTDTDVHTAVYSGNELQSFETITFKPGTAAGDYSVDIKIKDNNVDKVQGFVWENMNPVMDSVDFTKQ